jgi:hypothetical protein
LQGPTYSILNQLTPKIQELTRALEEEVERRPVTRLLMMLATAQERRVSVLPDMTQILQLEDWHHPNVVDNADRPSGSETFQPTRRPPYCRRGSYLSSLTTAEYALAKLAWRRESVVQKSITDVNGLRISTEEFRIVQF